MSNVYYVALVPAISVQETTCATKNGKNSGRERPLGCDSARAVAEEGQSIINTQ